MSALTLFRREIIHKLWSQTCDQEVLVHRNAAVKGVDNALFIVTVESRNDGSFFFVSDDGMHSSCYVYYSIAPLAMLL